jgi:hypothetical protein
MAPTARPSFTRESEKAASSLGNGNVDRVADALARFIDAVNMRVNGPEATLAAKSETAQAA